MLRESLPLSFELLSSALCAIVLVASKIARDWYACTHHAELSGRPLHAMLTQHNALPSSACGAMMLGASQLPRTQGPASGGGANQKHCMLCQSWHRRNRLVECHSRGLGIRYNGAALSAVKASAPAGVHHYIAVGCGPLEDPPRIAGATECTSFYRGRC